MFRQTTVFCHSRRHHRIPSGLAVGPCATGPTQRPRGRCAIALYVDSFVSIGLSSLSCPITLGRIVGAGPSTAMCERLSRSSEILFENFADNQTNLAQTGLFLSVES
jgi:hypothetical protein